MRQRLTPAMMTFVVVDVILVVTFVALLVLLRPGLGSDGPPAADPGTVTDAPPETTPDTAAPSEPASPETFTAFVLPSGNIWCAMSATTATCTILSYTFTPPAPPEGCSGSVGHMLQVVAGDGSQLVCPDDPQPVPEDTPTLEYGQASTVGEMTCHASTNGATCLHNLTGAGFSVARAGFRLF